MLSCLLHCRRLVARTLPFQGGEAGSIPVDSTNFLKRRSVMTSDKSDKITGGETLR